MTGAAAESRFRKIFTHSNDAGVILDPARGRVVEANPRATQLLGYSREELLSMPVSRIHPDEMVRFRAFESSVLEEGDGWTDQLTCLAKGGRKVPAEISASRVTLDGTPHIVAWIRDLTQQVRIREERRRTGRLTALGQITAGVTQDLNGLLARVAEHTSVLREKLREESTEGPSGDELAREIDGIEASLRRAGTLTAQLLALGSSPLLQPREVDLNLVASGMAGMLDRVLGDDIEVETETSPDLPAVLVDPGQLELVVMNLALHSRHLLAEGGVLRFSTRSVELEEDRTNDREHLSPGRYAVLTLESPGAGMDGETRKRIFEPLPGEGESEEPEPPGLHAARRIVRESAGELEVESPPEAGTAFRIFLPSTEES